MIKNVLEYLESTAEAFPEKKAFVDENGAYTYQELLELSGRIGSNLISDIRRPIVVYMEKSIQSIACFMGILASGNFYCPIDVDMPLERVKLILNQLNPAVIITNSQYAPVICKAAENDIKTVLYEKIIQESGNQNYLSDVRSRMVDFDPVYVLFTSGSTGIPKGVVISHHSVIDYAEWVTETFHITSNDSFGNQAPFYFDNSVLDIYTGLKNGATVYIIPKSCFTFLAKALDYLNENQITTIFWVPSVLCNLAKLRAFSKKKLETVNKVLFCGEVMPNKQLNYWRKNHPDALYANLYGPTEITDVCTYYIVDREFEDDEPLPIGKACSNTEIILLNEKDELAGEGELGELCVRGGSLALGYYADGEKSSGVFTQNPLNKSYRDFIYRTGDLAKMNERGEIIYAGRKDDQIKHMGHRIELGEIETAACSIDVISDSACIYDDEQQKIVFFYGGGEETEKKVLKEKLKQKLPDYMVPDKFIYMSNFPYNSNGKINRKQLKEDYMQM